MLTLSLLVLALASFLRRYKVRIVVEKDLGTVSDQWRADHAGD